MKPNILVTICARGGSKGIPGKNIRLLNGKPLIAHTIEQALQWSRAAQVVVSTESNEIASTAEEFGAVVTFERPAELAADATPKLEVLRHALIESEKIFQSRYNIIVDLDVTSPMRTVDDLEKCYHMFEQRNPKTLFSVVQARKNPYFNMVELNPTGYVKLSKRNKEVGSRQAAPHVYEMNASIYFYRRDYLINPASLSAISDESIAYEMGEDSRYDIDEENDFQMVELILKKRKEHLCDESI